MKTIYKIFTFSLLFSLTLGVSSCSEDFLETVPTDAVATETALGTVENMMISMNGIHRSLYAQNGMIRYYAGQQYMMPLAEFPAGDGLHSKRGNGWFRDVLQWVSHTDATNEDMEICWFYHYHIAGMANNIINAAEGKQESDLLHNVLGQAYTYRAWAHFNLVRWFAKPYLNGAPSSDLGVPIMLATEPPYEGKVRNTVQEVYDQITDDLTSALTHFESASSRVDISHLNEDVTNGIAARVYLTIGDWDKAASHAHEARQGYSLMNESEFKSGFNNWVNPEWIWGAEMIEDQTSYYWSYFYYVSNNFNGFQNRSNPKFMNHNLYNAMADTDYRKDLVFNEAPSTFDDWNSGLNEGRYADEDEYDAAVKEYYELVNSSTRHNLYPYMYVKMSQSDGPTITPMDVLHMRAAEMYLIEAEAEARGGSETAARAVLGELLQERYGNPDPAYVVTETGSALIEEILLQRRIELFMEGHRWFDMLRNDEELDLTGSGADPDLYLTGMNQARPSENAKWQFLIPQREIDANNNIVQNKH